MTNSPTNAISGNTIYLCKALDVLEFADKNQISVINTIKIYFHYLIKKDITSIESLKKNLSNLRLNSQKLINKEFNRNIENVDLFYKIYENRLTHLPYIDRGIKRIELKLHPKNETNLPLDIIFKIIHASRTVPLIKYNPSKRLEKIYLKKSSTKERVRKKP